MFLAHVGRDLILMVLSCDADLCETMLFFYSLGYPCDRILSALCLHKSHTCHLHFKSEGNPLMPLRRFLKFFLYTRVSLTDERGNSDRSCVRLLKTVDPSPAALKRAER